MQTGRRLFHASHPVPLSLAHPLKPCGEYCGQKKIERRQSLRSIGGGRWIRTTEVSDNRFTVCPIWPLWNSPI